MPAGSHPSLSENLHSRQTNRVLPVGSVTIPMVTPHAGQIGGRSSCSGSRFVIRAG